MNSKTAVAESILELKEFLRSTIELSKFELSVIKLSDQSEWQLKDGALSHVTGGFFHVNGLKNTETEEENLVFFQPQSALTGLALCRRNGTVYVLLQARVEPGNTGIGQYGPTIQSTPANYLGNHGGRKSSYVDLFNTFNPLARVIATSMQLDLGERYFQKSKAHVYVEVENLIETEQNMIWVALPSILKALELDNFLNADLRSLLSIFNWSRFLHKQDIQSPPEDSVNFFSQLINGGQSGAGQWQFIPIGELNNWELSDNGVDDVSNSGVSVSLYRISCTNREVRTWVQPLMRAADLGVVRLLVRNQGERSEFLLSLKEESGVSNGQTILPSYVLYPGGKSTQKPLLVEGQILAEFLQSDEGGRFIEHENLYQLVQTKGEFPVEDYQYWVSAHTLKKLLSTSNMVWFSAAMYSFVNC
jgi:oxidase EvaA